MMKRLALLFALLASPANAADLIIWYAAPGGTYSAHLVNASDTATVDFAFVSGRKYVITEGDIDAGVLASGNFTGEIFAEAASSLDLSTDEAVGVVGLTRWNGTTMVDPIADLIDGARLDAILDAVKAVTDALSPKLPAGTIADADDVGEAALPLTETGLTNFSTFFNNGDAATNKTISNVTAPKNVTITVPQQ